MSPVPRVSILVSSLNFERFIREAVDSALGQTFTDLEVIVIDDGSSDRSLECVSDIRDERLRVVAKQNGGQASCYNLALTMARGEFVLFLDGDDVLDRDLVARAIPLFEPGVSKVQFALRVVGPDSRSLGRCHPPEMQCRDARKAIDRFGSYASPPGSGNIYARWFLDRIMPVVPEDAFRSGADTWCILLAPFFGSIRSLDGPGGLYRVHVGSPRRFFGITGNVESRPARSLRSSLSRIVLVFDYLRATGLSEVGLPSLPPPWMLRVWALARIAGDRDPDRVFGCRLDAGTVMRSVAGWSAYGPMKRVVYGLYLLMLIWLPWGALGKLRGHVRRNGVVL